MSDCHLHQQGFGRERERKAGLSLVGKQGVKSIHRYLNSLKQTFKSIPDQASRIHQMMMEHYVHIAPTLYPLVEKEQLLPNIVLGVKSTANCSPIYH